MFVSKNCQTPARGCAFWTLGSSGSSGVYKVAVDQQTGNDRSSSVSGLEDGCKKEEYNFVNIKHKKKSYLGEPLTAVRRKRARSCASDTNHPLCSAHTGLLESSAKNSRTASPPKVQRTPQVWRICASLPVRARSAPSFLLYA